MPSRNVIKEYAPQSFYHIYNRGVNKQVIFVKEEDYAVFLSLLKRYLSKETPKNRAGRSVGKSFYEDIELQAYCLMPNHFHLLLYVNENPRAISELMRSVCTAYTMYFNKKYKRVGQLLQGRFKASRIKSDDYLVHISRYIHRNPKDYKKWPYSSVHYYIGDWNAEWVRPDKTYELYEYGTYESFLDDWQDAKEKFKEIEYFIANFNPR